MARNVLYETQSDSIAHPAFRNPQLESWELSSTIADGEQSLFDLPTFTAEDPTTFAMYLITVYDATNNDFDVGVATTDGTSINVGTLIDSGSAGFSDTFETDNKFNVDISSGQIRLNNEIGAAVSVVVTRLI